MMIKLKYGNLSPKSSRRALNSSHRHAHTRTHAERRRECDKTPTTMGTGTSPRCHPMYVYVKWNNKASCVDEVQHLRIYSRVVEFDGFQFSRIILRYLAAYVFLLGPMEAHTRAVTTFYEHFRTEHSELNIGISVDVHVDALPATRTILDTHNTHIHHSFRG